MLFRSCGSPAFRGVTKSYGLQHTSSWRSPRRINLLHRFLRRAGHCTLRLSLAEASLDCILRRVFTRHNCFSRLFDSVYGDSEPDAEEPSAIIISDDGGIHADHMPIDIDQRPPGVSSIYGRVRLNKILFF